MWIWQKRSAFTISNRIRKPHVHVTTNKFLRGVRHIRLFKQKTGTKFRFYLEPKTSVCLFTLPHAGMYIPAKSGHGAEPLAGVGGRAPFSKVLLYRKSNFVHIKEKPKKEELRW